MLTLTSDQIDAFQAADERELVDRMLAHLRVGFSRHLNVMGENRSRQMARLGLERARCCGLELESSFLSYGEWMLMFGAFFDEDLQLPWAGSLLHGSALYEDIRMRELRERARHYATCVAGPDQRHIREALRRAATIQLHELRGSGGAVADEAASRLAWLLPSKCAALGPSGVSDLVADGVRTCARRYAVTDGGVVLYICLMFLLGSRFAEDPMFSWAAEVLDDPAPLSASARTERLYHAALLRLDAWLAGVSRTEVV